MAPAPGVAIVRVPSREVLSKSPSSALLGAGSPGRGRAPRAWENPAQTSWRRRAACTQPQHAFASPEAALASWRGPGPRAAAQVRSRAPRITFLDQFQSNVDIFLIC